jgi:hypothetical protein
MLAEFESPATIQNAVESRFGVRVSRETIYHYRSHPRWKKIIEDKRRALDHNLEQLAIGSRYWRMKKREELVEKASCLVAKSSDVAAPGALLMDAAKELGQVAAETPTTLIGQINIQLIRKVLALPEEALDTYIKEGKLPAESYLSDLHSAGGNISIEESDPAVPVAKR